MCFVVAGVLELVTGIPEGTILKLESKHFPENTEYIELIQNPAEMSAIIRTKKPLDVAQFHEVSCLTSTHAKKSEFKSCAAVSFWLSLQCLNFFCVCLSE